MIDLHTASRYADDVPDIHPDQLLRERFGFRVEVVGHTMPEAAHADAVGTLRHELSHILSLCALEVRHIII